MLADWKPACQNKTLLRTLGTICYCLLGQNGAKKEWKPWAKRRNPELTASPLKVIMGRERERLRPFPLYLACQDPQSPDVTRAKPVMCPGTAERMVGSCGSTRQVWALPSSWACLMLPVERAGHPLSFLSTRLSQFQKLLPQVQACAMASGEGRGSAHSFKGTWREGDKMQCLWRDLRKEKWEGKYQRKYTELGHGVACLNFINSLICLLTSMGAGKVRGRGLKFSKPPLPCSPLDSDE